MQSILRTKNSNISIVITVVRDAKGLQPIETYGHTSDADAETYQIFAPA